MACQKVCKQGGMMHESKGQHIGKAPSLHLFPSARSGPASPDYKK